MDNVFTAKDARKMADQKAREMLPNSIPAIIASVKKIASSGGYSLFFELEKQLTKSQYDELHNRGFEIVYYQKQRMDELPVFSYELYWNNAPKSE